MRTTTEVLEMAGRCLREVAEPAGPQHSFWPVIADIDATVERLNTPPAPGPKTEFSADECQALLDLMDRAARGSPWSDTLEDHAQSYEERAVLAKLREGGKFYVPE